MSELQLTQRIGVVFQHVFGERLPFEPKLSRLDEPRWTSMKHVELVIGLEREFGIRLDGADATDMADVPSIVERVQAKLE
jgi:acyl carrier protein